MNEEPTGRETEEPLPRDYISRALRRGRLSHAYVLLGPAGSGRLAFAEEAAKLLFCERGGPCGECVDCRRIDHGNHAGVTIYGPLEGRAVIDIDTVREMCDRSHYARSHAFVAILRHAEKLTPPAANALLKTLEEPPGAFVLLLIATSAGALLPTIVSRCHRLYFPALTRDRAEGVDQEALAEALEEDFVATRDLRDWLARCVPEESTQRARVRRLLHAWVTGFHAELEGAGPEAIDTLADRLDSLLEYRAALDGNVNPDLVLEKALACVRG